MKPKNISVLVMPVTACPALQVFREMEMRKPTAIIGPHVSILGPFEPEELTAQITMRIRDVAGSYAPFQCVFPQFCVFADAGVLYLSVYPSRPFENLRDAILQEIPEYRPEFAGPVFHLSIGCGFALPDLPDLMARAHAQLDRFMPIETTLTEVQLADRIDGVWSTRATFRLKRTKAPTRRRTVRRETRRP